MKDMGSILTTIVVYLSKSLFIRSGLDVMQDEGNTTRLINSEQMFCKNNVYVFSPTACKLLIKFSGVPLLTISGIG